MKQWLIQCLNGKTRSALVNTGRIRITDTLIVDITASLIHNVLLAPFKLNQTNFTFE
jgi:hypothetical protein